MRRLCLAASLLWLARAETIDRLAITINNQIITQLQIDEELRVAALLNRESAVVRSVENRRDAADRLVKQFLIQFEMQLSRYTLPDSSDIDQYYLQIAEANGGTAEFEKALLAFSLTPGLLRSHLELQLTELKFIDVRFRPDANVSDADIEAAYKVETASWKKTHTGTPPSLEISREALRALLVEERTDAALDTWLEESRKRVRLIYLDKTLQ